MFFASGDIPAGQTCAGVNVYHWVDTGWSDSLSLDPAYGSGGRDCSGEPFSVQVTGVSDFSRFVLKADDDPTRVTLRHFGTEGTSGGLVVLLAVLLGLSLSLAGLRWVLIRR